MVSNNTKKRKEQSLLLNERFMRFINESREKHTFEDIIIFKQLIANKKDIVVSNNFELVVMAFIFLCQKKTLIVSSHINYFKLRYAAKKYLNHDCSISTILDIASEFTIKHTNYSTIKWDRVIYYDVSPHNDIISNIEIMCHHRRHHE